MTRTETEARQTTTEQNPVIVWFRHDLRICDHAPLTAAVRSGKPVICVYHHADNTLRAEGGASRWWLHYSLTALKESLSELGCQLIITTGDAASQLTKLARVTKAEAIEASRQYEPEARLVEQTLSESLQNAGCVLHLHSGYLLLEPEHISSKTGSPYKVFTPFWRSCREKLVAQKPLPAPSSIPCAAAAFIVDKGSIDGLQLLPHSPDWGAKLKPHWQVGEAAAQQRLRRFIKEELNQYDVGRDIPAETLTSRLSPHLHFGEISPQTVLHLILTSKTALNEEDKNRFISELGWREFCHHLLWHWPTIVSKPFNPKYLRFPWKRHKTSLVRWQQGRTGIPIVDAGMRQLWQTGWMHNRVRMIVASLLVKNLLIPWQDGEAWFWDTLVDASTASNVAGWQWVAGCGADAAPYFRIFNPVTQAQKFDPQAIYIKRWVPELEPLPAKYAHAPWEAPAHVLQTAKISLGKNYPEPIVDLKTSRQQALDALAQCNAS